MSTRSIILFILLVSSMQSFAAKKNPAKYFRHLVFRESPVSYQRGIYPIDKKEAKTVAHYRFEYDDQQRVTEISHRIGDDLIAPNGNWDSFTWFAPKMTIEYAKDKQIIRYFNEFDEAFGAHDGVFKAEYTLDEQGRRVALHLYGEDSQPVENAWKVHRYIWDHQTDGTIIEKRYNLKDEATTQRPELTFYTIKLEFGDDDLLDFIYHIDENGELINNSMGAAIDRIVYDQDENFSRWMVFDRHRRPYEGNRPQFAIGEHLYDAFGNKVGLRGYDIYGQNKAWPNGFALETNTYDKHGNKSSERYEDIDGNLIIALTYEYSKDGKRRTKVIHVDDSGNPVNHKNWGWAWHTIEYDKEGKVSGTKLFTADGKELQPKTQG